MVTRKYIRDYKLSESVTARGGIRTEADLRLFLENGCDRLGASAAVTALGD